MLLKTHILTNYVIYYYITTPPRRGFYIFLIYFSYRNKYFYEFLTVQRYDIFFNMQEEKEKILRFEIISKISIKFVGKEIVIK